MRADLEYGSIPGMALRNAERFGDAPAIIDDGGTVSYAEVGERLRVVARSLMAGGVGPGDRVALWAPNSAGWITTALGILATGARLVPLNTRFKGREASYVLAATRARTLVCANGFLGFDYVDMLRQTDIALPALADTVLLDGEADATTSWAEFTGRADRVSDDSARRRAGAIGPDDPSDVMFTSGTTGHPKGVMLRHGASLRAYELFNRSFGLTAGDRLLIIAPFFHCFGYKAGWMVALMNGAVSVPMAAFDPATALRLIEQRRITHTGGAPTMFWALLDHPSRAERDLSSLRVATASAAYVPAELIARMTVELGLHATTGYGLTEAHALVSASPPDDPPELIARWSGRLVDGTHARVVDDAGRDVPVGQQGELLVRGFQLMDGYWDDPAATAEVIDADGWLHTGDVAYLNADAYLKICDRKKEMFIVGGFNVAPAEVEGLLLECDRVAECAVVGVPDARWGEVGAAFVVPASPGLTAAEVQAWARDHMANYKVPHRVELVDALPVNATGKVVKSELRALLAATPPAAGEPPAPAGP